MIEQGRHYRILGVLGEGGFGRVYKARLEDESGFVKEVAIKLGDEDAPEEVLKRFRDEARILGLVRDRAIVAVEPPTRLGDNWAVVMEYVEGASLEQMLAARSRLPAKVAIGIVQEVARALDNVYTATGPEGQPLHLVHRDLKPANLQLTKAGEVKILDFGLARAKFVGREADSSANIGGTLGYIAPERLDGAEGPEGDVYSLGVVLRTALTGVGPRHWKKFSEESTTAKDPDEIAARHLADLMTAAEPEKRPTAREVEEQCAALIGRLKGPTLRNWCLEHVRPNVTTGRDARIGSVLSETLATIPRGVEDSQHLVRPRGPSRSLLLAATMGSVGTGIAVGVALILVVGVGVWWALRLRPGDVVVVEPELHDVLPTAERPAPTPAPPPEVVPAPEAAPVAPVEKPVARFPVTFDSEPPGAVVFVDGVEIGVTPLLGANLPQGVRSLKLEFGFDAIDAQIQVGPKGPKKYLWEIGEPLQVSY